MNLLNMNHPHASLSNILTFMWCAWKSRNDMLFNRKMGEPYQISINARALTTNQDFVHEVNLTLQANTNCHLVQAPGCNLQGATIDTDSGISGCVLIVDASWGCRSVPAVDGAQYTSLGVLIRNEQDGRSCSIMIQATIQRTSSVFQAEAKALLLAAILAQSLHIQRPTFLTDNQILAKVCAARRLDHPLLRWDSRNTIADFLRATKASFQVFHIKRDLNGVAHCNSPSLVLQNLNQIFTFSFHCIIASIFKLLNMK